MYRCKADVIQLAGTAPTAFQYETRHTSAFYNLPKFTKKQMFKCVRLVLQVGYEVQKFTENIRLNITCQTKKKINKIVTLSILK